MDSELLHKAKNLALKILSRRDHSAREMRLKLKKKGISEDAIADTIDWLYKKKLVDDKIFAMKKAESIYRTKLVGPLYIKMKLREAGIAESTAEAVVDNLASDANWNGRAKKALVQWKKAHVKHAEDRVRHMRFLASRGFSDFSPLNKGE